MTEAPRMTELANSPPAPLPSSIDQFGNPSLRSVGGPAFCAMSATKGRVCRRQLLPRACIFPVINRRRPGCMKSSGRTRHPHSPCRLVGADSEGIAAQMEPDARPEAPCRRSLVHDRRARYHSRHDSFVLLRRLMLLSLTIRDFVLIERLELAFRPGLCVLTGETGAGKSILLDALGLALGMRAESGLVRRGAAQAVVSAEFTLPPDHAVWPLLAEHGLEAVAADGTLVLRRVLGADGRSRAFIADAPASVGLMRQVGDLLVEIQGQFEQHGLLDVSTHRELLDAFGGHERELTAQATAWRDWLAAAAARQEAVDHLARARADEDYLRHALAELDAMEPQEGEEERLAETRAVLMHREKLVA